jgi:GR25 family glycosyltransferase involved in LPS biosynthesis
MCIFFCVLVCFIILLVKKIQQERNKRFSMYVINLKRSADRKENFEKYRSQVVNHHRWHCEFVDAVDAGRMENTRLFKKWPGMTQSKTHNNYKALQLSVVKCLKRAQQNESVEWAVVCEDDAELPKDLDFNQIVRTYPDSKVIYLDSRNPKGDGVVPGCCMNGVMYHRSVFDTFIKELHPDTSEFLTKYVKEQKRHALNDWYIHWLIRTKRVPTKCSSHPIVRGHNFKSTVSIK